MRYPLGPGREFGRIRAIAAALGTNAGDLGGDCAILPAGDGFLALSTDVSVEEVHFRRDWLAPDEIGWRAAAGALSDLAAAAAEPVGLLAAVTLPRSSADEELVALMRGVGAAAAAVGARVLGGDLSAGACWSVAVTVIGRAARPLSRAGAKPGDGIWVTGVLGGARAAVEALRRGEPPPPGARAAFARPLPRVAAGRRVAELGARAMMDLSDGLAGDATHLAAASGVAIDVDLERVPVAPDVAAVAARLGMPPTAFAAQGGEDYELLAALPPDFGEDGARRFRAEVGLALTRVGAARAGTGVRLLSGGAEVALRGYDHFA